MKTATLLAVLTAISFQVPASAQYLVDTGPYWTVPGVNGSYMTHSMGVGPAYYGPPANYGCCSYPVSYAPHSFGKYFIIKDNLILWYDSKRKLKKDQKAGVYNHVKFISSNW